MKSALLVALGLIVGGLLGAIGGGTLGTGVGAGFGIATGLHSGACLTLEAAREKGLITVDQEGEIWKAAVEKLSSSEQPEGTEADYGKIDCSKILSELKANK